MKQRREIAGKCKESISKVHENTNSQFLVYLQSFQVSEFFECSRLNVCDAVVSKRSEVVIKEGYLCVDKKRNPTEPIVGLADLVRNCRQVVKTKKSVKCGKMVIL